MRLINTKIHALIDYLLGVVLAFSPWLFDFDASGDAFRIPLFVGLLAASLALVTRFEFAPVKILPLRLHLITDVISGCFLASSPWTFNFSDNVYKPHLVLGLTHAVIAVITDRLLYDKVKFLKKHTDAEGNMRFL